MTPSFHLRNLLQVVDFSHVSASQSTPGHRPGGLGTVPPQPTGSSDSRIAEWATANRQAGSAAGFAARLDGAQVGAELMEIFRETPEFGRSLATRMEPFLDESARGSLTLIGGGGEATVFYDESPQNVIKLFAPPGKARFGWVTDRDAEGRWSLRAGTLTEALIRFFGLKRALAAVWRWIR